MKQTGNLLPFLSPILDVTVEEHTRFGINNG